MKNIFLTLMLLLSVCSASAQLIKPKEQREQATIDAKYLAGAAPLRDGKVVFSRDINLPDAIPADSVYDVLHKWMGRYFNARREVLKRLDLGSNRDKAFLKLGVVKMLTFRKSAFVLDRTQIIYNFSMQVVDRTVKVSMDSISYYYDAERDPIRYTAEEWISDETALTKDKTDIYRKRRKFRIKTIDLFDTTCKSLTRELSLYGR